VAVAAIGTTGTLTTFSNYGATHVDIAAPGNNVLSTFPGNQYVKESGTSMACPMVTGAVALTLASNKNLTWSQLKNRLLRGADQTYALNNKVWSDGKLNVKNTLKDLVGIHYPGSNFIRPAAAPLPTATASTTTTSSASSILSLASSTFSTRAIELGGDSLA